MTFPNAVKDLARATGKTRNNSESKRKCCAHAALAFAPQCHRSLQQTFLIVLVFISDINIDYNC